MAIYSRNLGILRHTGGPSGGVLYTVPGTAGPAVVKSVIATVPAGMLIELYATVAGVNVDLVVLDNTAGATSLFKDVETFQPLEPGSVINWASGGTSTNAASVLIGGYQFDAP